MGCCTFVNFFFLIIWNNFILVNYNKTGLVITTFVKHYVLYFDRMCHFTIFNIFKEDFCTIPYGLQRSVGHSFRMTGLEYIYN